MNVPLLPNQLTPVLPLEVPPRAGSQLPPLPPTKSAKQTDKFWHVTRHVFPAAYPRSRAGCYVARPVRENASAAGSKISREEIETQVAAMKTRQDTAPLQGEAEGGHLWIAANCYRRKLQQPSERTGSTRRRPGVTLILVHATGLHKEVGDKSENVVADVDLSVWST